MRVLCFKLFVRSYWALVSVLFVFFDSYCVATAAPTQQSEKLAAEKATEECGVNSLFALLRLYGVSAKRAEVVLRTRLTGRGSTVAELMECARQYDLPLCAVRATPARLETLPLPAVVHLDGDVRGHFCVLTAVRRASVDIIDGNSLARRRDVSKGAFLRDWSGVVLLVDQRANSRASVWWIVAAATLGFANCCVYGKLIVRQIHAGVLKSPEDALSSSPANASSALSVLKCVSVFVGVTTVAMVVCFAAKAVFLSEEDAPTLADRPSSADELRRAVRHQPLRLHSPAGSAVRIPPELLKLVLAKALPVRSERTWAIHEFLHSLRIWGHSLSDVPGCYSSTEMLGIVTESRRHQAYYAQTAPAPPLLLSTRFGFGTRVFGGRDDVASTSHIGNVVQVLGEMGLPSDSAVRVESRDCRVVDGLVDLMARFNLEDELEFATVAFCHYLPPTRKWRNRHGQEISFDAIARTLVQQQGGVCYGTHRLYALATLLNANKQSLILSSVSRALVMKALKQASRALEKSQVPDGLWDGSWSDPTAKRNAPPRLTELITSTGHHLEWIALVPREIAPGDDTIRQAAVSLAHKILSTPSAQLDLHYGPLSHAANALMLLSRTPPGTVVLQGTRRELLPRET